MAQGEAGWAKRALGEPLLHFALLAGCVFALAHARGAGTGERVIALNARKQRELTALFTQRHGRAPSASESAQLAERFVEDEVLLREAASLALSDQQGPVRDATLAQMRSLLQGAAAAQEPSEQTLRTFHAAHRADYRVPARVTLYEYVIPFDSDAEDSARELSRALAAGEAVARPRSEYLLSTEADLTQLRGAAWAKRVFELSEGSWTILRSPRGLHVVRVEQRVPAEEPTFEVLRPQLRADLQAQAVERRFAAQLARLRNAYDVRVERAAP